MFQSNELGVSVEASKFKVCIDNYVDGSIKGEFYHCYMEKPIDFYDSGSLVLRIDRERDRLKFPVQTNKTRSFFNLNTNTDEKISAVKYKDIKEFREGELATFIFLVEARQNSQWLCNVIEGGKAIKDYSCIYDLMYDIDNFCKDLLKKES